MTVQQSEAETELHIRWRGTLFNSSEVSDVSLALKSDGSLSIEWLSVALPRGGSLESGLSAWLLGSTDLPVVQNTSLTRGAMVPGASGRNSTKAAVVGAVASARDASLSSRTALPSQLICTQSFTAPRTLSKPGPCGSPSNRKCSVPAPASSRSVRFASFTGPGLQSLQL